MYSHVIINSNIMNEFVYWINPYLDIVVSQIWKPAACVTRPLFSLFPLSLTLLAVYVPLLRFLYPVSRFQALAPFECSLFQLVSPCMVYGLVEKRFDKLKRIYCLLKPPSMPRQDIWGFPTSTIHMLCRPTCVRVSMFMFRSVNIFHGHFFNSCEETYKHRYW